MLSKYFSLDEMLASQTAARKGINNEPTDEHMLNLIDTCHRADAVREFLGHPMIVSSGYRSPKLNAAVGGSKTSAHCRGEAIDFTCPGFGTPAEVFKALKASGLRFDQCIVEYDTWVHIGYADQMRHQFLAYDGQYSAA